MVAAACEQPYSSSRSVVKYLCEEIVCQVALVIASPEYPEEKLFLWGLSSVEVLWSTR